MRVTYLHQYFNTNEMIGGTRSFEMARRLVAMGHEVNMVTSWRDYGDRNDWFCTTESGIKVNWLPVAYSNHMSYQQRLRAFVNFAILSARKAASIKSDVVFATSTPLTIAMPAVYAARRMKVPMVFEVRDLWPQVPIALNVLRNPISRWLASILEKWAYNSADAVVALAPGMKAGIVKRGYPASRVGVIPNGADDYMCTHKKEDVICELRCKHSWIKSGPLIVYAGAFGFVNDLDFMVELAFAIKNINPNMSFVAIGDGARWSEIEKLAIARGVLNKNFFLLGSVPKKEVLKWLSAADAILVLYKGPKVVWEDCVSNKLFDAMAAGKPILSNVPGWGPKIAEAAGAGLVLDGRGGEADAVKVNEKLSDSEWLRSAGNSSRKLGKEVFNRDMQATQLEALLSAVVNGRPETAATIAPGIYC